MSSSSVPLTSYLYTARIQRYAGFSIDGSLGLRFTRVMPELLWFVI